VTLSLHDASFRRVREWPTLIGVSIATMSALGQPASQSGQIVGTVRGNSGQQLAGASIILSESENGAKWTRVSSDANGKYALVNIPYGAYTLAAASFGFRQSEPKSLIVASATETVDFTLAPLSKSGAAETLKSGSMDGAEKGPPTFSPAGVQGTTAPSGYSAGLSQEEATHVMDRVDSLRDEVLSALPPGEVIADCNQEADLLTAAQRNPESFDPNHALGIFYFGHGNFIQSISYFKRAYEARPADTNNSRELALALLDARQYSDAVSLLERIRARDSKDAALLRHLALAYEASGKLQKSATEFVEAARLDAGEENLFDCGIGLIGLGAADEAVTLFKPATMAHPGSARLWMGLGIAQDLQKHKIDAIQSLLRSVDVDPEYFPPYSFLADLSGASLEADTQIRRRLAVLVVAHPESAEAHYDYALLLWKQHILSPATADPAEIESQLRLAVAKDPKMARAHFQLGVVYADSGDNANSVAELRETVRLEPGNAEAHYHLAQSYRRNQQPDLANQEMKQFVAMHGGPARAEDDSVTEFRKLAPRLNREEIEVAPCHEGKR
jgi:tetratricopeptide (TPR) repeat protein